MSLAGTPSLGYPGSPLVSEGLPTSNKVDELTAVRERTKRLGQRADKMKSWFGRSQAGHLKPASADPGPKTGQLFRRRNSTSGPPSTPSEVAKPENIGQIAAIAKPGGRAASSILPQPVPTRGNGGNFSLLGPCVLNDLVPPLDLNIPHQAPAADP